MNEYITIKNLIDKLSNMDENSIVIISHMDDDGEYFVPLENENINVGKYETIERSTYSISFVHYSKLTNGLKELYYTEKDIENFENKNGIKCVTFR